MGFEGSDRTEFGEFDDPRPYVARGRTPTQGAEFQTSSSAWRMLRSVTGCSDRTRVVLVVVS